MTETIRETENFELAKCMYNGIIAFYNLKTKEQTNWITGRVEIRDQINLIKHLSDDEFDSYAKSQIKAHNEENSDDKCCN
jgi:hypothetical protein